MSKKIYEISYQKHFSLAVFDVYILVVQFYIFYLLATVILRLYCQMLISHSSFYPSLVKSEHILGLTHLAGHFVSV
jgi:hypothetical protein